MGFKKYIAMFSLFFTFILMNAQDKDAVTFEVELSKEKLGINETNSIHLILRAFGFLWGPLNELVPHGSMG